MSRYGWYNDYTPTKPIETKGGIKSKAKGGVHWWSKRWYDFMESFNLGARLARGKSYARKGQVIDVSVESGLVQGQVQGSRPTPYKVSIHFEPISEEGWERIVSRLGEQILFSAQLMAGEVPQELEDFFQAEGASLFPVLKRRADMHCNCPDSSNPCKHIAALFYVLGDAFDQDPFLLLELRGMPREKLATLLGNFAGSKDSGKDEDTLPEDEPEDILDPLPLDESFYKGASFFDVGPLPRSDLGAPLLRRLGNLPFWRGDAPLLESLQEIYKEAAQRGRAVALGDMDKVKASE